jgi:hypothetical protein
MPSDEEGVKASQSNRSSPADLPAAEAGEKGVASALRGGDEGGMGEAYRGTEPSSAVVGAEVPTRGDGLCCYEIATRVQIVLRIRHEV